MKDTVTNFDEVFELVNQISQFEPISIEVIICMIIDTESAKYKKSVVEILGRICDAVQAVNEVLGPYRAGMGEGHDHKNYS